MPSRYKSKKKHSKNRKYKLKTRKHKSKRTHTKKRQKGGFNSCSLATVQESGFSIPALGDIPALNIPQAKGVIYRPNCTSDTYQAMTPL